MEIYLVENICSCHLKKVNHWLLCVSNRFFYAIRLVYSQAVPCFSFYVNVISQTRYIGDNVIVPECMIFSWVNKKELRLFFFFKIQSMSFLKGCPKGNFFNTLPVMNFLLIHYALCKIQNGISSTQRTMKTGPCLVLFYCYLHLQIFIK